MRSEVVRMIAKFSRNYSAMQLWILLFAKMTLDQLFWI